MSDCIFCKIVAGEIPASVVYEDEDCLAFMDIGPIIEGHVLVIPKEHWEGIADIPENKLTAVHRVVKRIALAQMNGLKADGVNILQNTGRAAGQEVFHYHVHVIPRFVGDGHHWNWNPRRYASSDEMTALAEKIRNAVAKKG